MEIVTPIREARFKGNGNTVSPIRRSLAVASTPAPISEQGNDDESERNRRRSRAEVARNVSKANSTVVEYTQTMQEHFDTCLQLFAQNKINVKNVWKLRIIDYLRAALEAKGDLGDVFKLAGTSLEVSSKIYSLRVDDLHSDMMKLADTLLNIRINKQKEGANEDGAASDEHDDEGGNEEGGRQDKQRKRRKKTKTVNIVSEEQLNGTLSRTDAAYKRNLVHSDSSEVPTNLKLPVACGTYKVLMPCLASIQPLWHTETRKLPSKLKRPPIGMQKVAAICPSFSDFAPNELDNERLSQLTNTSLCSRVVYDEDGIPVPDVDVEPANTIHADQDSMDEDEHNDGNTEIVRAVEMRPQLGDDNDLEYSYRPIAPITNKRFGIVGAWAGPAHWKIKHLRRARTSVGVERQSAPRERRIIVPTDLTAERPPTPPLMQLDQRPNKPKKSNTFDKTRLPEDAEIHKIVVEELLLKPGTFIKPGKFYRSHSSHPSKDLNSSKVTYEYENREDVNYCRRIPEVGPGWVDVDNVDDHHDGDAMDDNREPVTPNQPIDTSDWDDIDAELARALAEQDVPAPAVVLSQQQLAYASRSKKINMKALKQSIWEVIESPSQQPQGVAFSQLLNELPPHLPHKTAEELSDPIAFAALLHICNEKILYLEANNPERTDFIIRKD